MSQPLNPPSSDLTNQNPCPSVDAIVDPALLAEALRISRIGCWQYDNATGRLTWSPEMFTLMGFDPAEGAPSYDVMVSHVHPRDVRVHWSALQRALRDNKSYDFDIRLDRAFTPVEWLHVTIQPVADVGGRVERLFGVAIDISERKSAEGKTVEYAILLEQKMIELRLANERLEALATTDGLTGITNHRAFYERFGEEFQRSRRSDLPLALVILDVDRFKSYNDSFGHQAGDAVLKKIASVLQGSIRTSDLVARYGGEEFVIILPETDACEAALTAERCRAAVEQADWGSRIVTASFGVAVSTEALTVDEIIAAADRALYAAKSAGRNCVCVG